MFSSPTLEHSQSSPTQRRHDSESAASLADHSPSAIAQRKREALLGAPSLQRKTAQREAGPEEEELLQGKFATAQREGLEEEEPLQGKFGTLQRLAPEEEELPLQGKFATAQREGLEEEEPLQGKFGTLQLLAPEEEELPVQGKFATAQREGLEEEEPLQGKFATSPVQREEEAPAPNRTGMPDNLKSGIENLSGHSLDDVQVHYNSSKPAQLNALAYAQGTDIHVAPGQEQHLPHEAWHVVQQAQGRVQPTMQMNGDIPVNDDVGLETEADVMGAKALNGG